jgi:hypothetical protein
LDRGDGPSPAIVGGLDDLKALDLDRDPAPEMEGVNSRFYVDRAVVETSSHTGDVDRCVCLWNESARLGGLEP